MLLIDHDLDGDLDRRRAGERRRRVNRQRPREIERRAGADGVGLHADRERHDVAAADEQRLRVRAKRINELIETTEGVLLLGRSRLLVTSDDTYQFQGVCNHLQTGPRQHDCTAVK